MPAEGNRGGYTNIRVLLHMHSCGTTRLAAFIASLKSNAPGGLATAGSIRLVWRLSYFTMNCAVVVSVTDPEVPVKVIV